MMNIYMCMCMCMCVVYSSVIRKRVNFLRWEDELIHKKLIIIIFWERERGVVSKKNIIKKKNTQS